MIASSRALRGLASGLASAEGVAVEDGAGAVEGVGLEGGHIDKVGLVRGGDVVVLVGLEGAVLYYTSCWDCVGMKFDIVGIDPNSRHPKPRPPTPQDLFKTLLFLYQKENYRNT